MSDIILFRAQIGLFHCNVKCKLESKNKFSLLKIAFSRFQLEIWAMIYIIFNIVGFLCAQFFINYYDNLKFARTIFLLVSMNKCLHYLNPASVLPVIKLLLYIGGIFYITKTLFSMLMLSILNRDEPVLFLLLFLVKNILEMLMENINTNYNYRWAEMLHIYGDIHQNPGPTQKTEHLQVMHWNLNSFKKYNFSRVSLLQAYNSMFNFHVMAISESALSNKIENVKINIPGYNLIRYDLMGNHTHGGVLIYYKQDLSAIQRIDLDNPTYTLVLELSINRKKVFFVSSYRKHGQTNEEYKIYSTKLDDLMDKISLENPFAIIITGDYNSHNKKWYQGDNSDEFGLDLQETFEKYSMFQMVNQPTFISKWGMSSTLVDLFATNQRNLVMAN